MIQVLRRTGIAIGSLVIGYLAVGMVGGALLGPTATSNGIVEVAIVVLGGLVYRDIIRRERRPA